MRRFGHPLLIVSMGLLGALVLAAPHAQPCRGQLQDLEQLRQRRCTCDPPGTWKVLVLQRTDFRLVRLVRGRFVRRRRARLEL